MSLHRVTLAAVGIICACSSASPRQIRDTAAGAGGMVALRPGSYEFEYSVNGTRITVDGLPQPYEESASGSISIIDRTTLTLQPGLSPGNARRACRLDVADQLDSADSELVVRCEDIRLRLHQVNGELVGGIGSAEVQTYRGTVPNCELWTTDPRTGRASCSQWGRRVVLDRVWHEAVLRVVRRH